MPLQQINMTEKRLRLTCEEFPVSIILVFFFSLQAPIAYGFDACNDSLVFGSLSIKTFNLLQHWVKFLLVVVTKLFFVFALNEVANFFVFTSKQSNFLLSPLPTTTCGSRIVPTSELFQTGYLLHLESHDLILSLVIAGMCSAVRQCERSVKLRFILSTRVSTFKCVESVKLTLHLLWQNHSKIFERGN